MESDVRKNLQLIENALAPFSARLVPVTKTYPVEKILEAYQAGYREFGENKVQEILEKKDQLPVDVKWHLIGHLQTNKVKSIVPFVDTIQSVDSEKLLVEIEKQAAKINRIVPCLLQVYIASEDSKTGWDPMELKSWFAANGPLKFPHVAFRGLMGMASFTSDEEVVRREFRGLKGLFDEFRVFETLPNVEMKELSMGMSGDFRIACEEGSTLVRMGTAIFGSRSYQTDVK